MRREIGAHVLTSIGVLCALFAVLAVFDQAWEFVYGWLALALLVEAVGDNWLPPAEIPSFFSFESEPARTTSLTHTQASGIVGFLNGVFVPVVAMLHAGFLDGLAGVGLAAIVLLSALYRLAFSVPAPSVSPDSTVSHFIGLPAAWGIVGYYLHAFDATPAAAVLTIGLGVILSLLPLRWPHPLSCEVWPKLTQSVVAGWVLTVATTLWHGLPAAAAAKTILLAAVGYGILVTVLMAQAAASRPKV